MSTRDDNFRCNDVNYEYDLYGDTRNGIKHNEEKKYSKHSYNYKDILRIGYIKAKKELKNKENNDEKCEEIEKVKKNKKREIKRINEENENFGNNQQKIREKPKKKKKPKKDMVRF